MNIDEIPVSGYEQVLHAVDEAAGLNAFISIHSTVLGPALGGLRMLPYRNEAEALEDVNRLAKAMTYKAAVAQTGQGGGKAVIIGDPKHKTEAMFRAMGRFIDALDGRYITAEDMNITVADLEIIARETRWVTGLPVEKGSSGNPSPMTALGCFVGVRASVREMFGTDDLGGRRVAIQGIGAVGHRLAGHCLEAGMDVAVCDLDPGRVREFKRLHPVTPLETPDAALEYPCDILSPCARGGVLSAQTIPRLNCSIVAGAANNQLGELTDADRLAQRGILYAPDYVINAGGILNIACEFAPGGYNEAAARERVKQIGPTLTEVYKIARSEDISTAAAANRLAEERLAAGRKA